MNVVTASQARSNLFRLIDNTAEHHEPVLITGKRNNAVLIGEQDWKSIQETMYLLSVPGMKESVSEAMNAPASEFISLDDFRAEMEKEADNAP